MINKYTVAKILIIIVMLSLIIAMAFGCDQTTSTVVGTVTPDDESTTSNITYTQHADDTVSVSGYTGTDTSIVVSATAGGLPVTSIGNVFQGSNITSITLPDTVTTLSASAFENCTSLSKITAKGVVTIGANAFNNTKWLANKSSDDLMYFNNVFIGVKYENTTPADFSNVEFSSSTTSVQDGALSSLSATTSFTIPASMYLTGREFDGFSSVESFNISSGRGDTKYWKNSASGELVSADGTVLYKYPEGNREDYYAIPSSIKVIESYACQNAQFETLSFGCTAELVKDYAFNNCYNLSRVSYANTTRGFAETGGYIFSGCSNLTKLETPATLTKLGDNALVNSSIATITFREAENFVEIGKNAFKGVKTFVGNADGSLTLPNTVKKIGSAAFANTSLVDVTLGDGMERLGALAFYGTPISTITLNNGLLTIGDEAFYMTGITSVTLPNSLLSIGTASFASSQLAHVYFGEHGSTDTTSAQLESIGASAFRDTPLISFTVPFSVTSIGAHAFAETPSLAMVNVMRSKASEITASGMYVFDGSTAMIRVPIDSLDAYREAYGWQDFSDRIDALARDNGSFTFVFNTCGGGTKASITNPIISLTKEEASMTHVAKDQTPLALLDVDKSTITLSSTIYMLEGWYKDAEYTQKITFDEGGAVLNASDFIEVAGVGIGSYYYINLYAKWITYNIAFDVHGGSSINTIATANPSIALSGITTTLENMTFDGWYYDAELQIGVETVDGALSMTADRYQESTITYKYSHFVQYTYYSYNVTLHAKWRQNENN